MREREFAMINVDLANRPSFIRLSSGDKNFYYSLLTYESINLRGVGRVSWRFFKKALRWSQEEIEGSLSRLEEAEFLSFDVEDQLVYLRGWWGHTSLSQGVLEGIIRGLKNGSFLRSELGFEEVVLKELLEELENPGAGGYKKIKAAITAEAKSLVNSRLSEIEEETSESENPPPVDNSDFHWSGFENKNE